MKRLAAAAGGVSLILLAASAPGQSARNPAGADSPAACAPTRAVVDRIIRPWIVHGERGPDRKAVGVALGVYLNGTECYFNYGTTRLGSDETPTRHTLFEIGSVTKTFTATMLALREVRNPVFSARSLVNTSRIPCAGKLCLKLANGMDQLTYRELATFTGGLPDDPTNLGGIGMRHYTQADFIAYLNGLAPPPSGLPATDSYSNSSYGFLGQLLMALDGYHDFDDPAAFRASFNEWIGDGITGPLAMTCTTADIAALPSVCNAGAEMATGYRYEQGRYVAVREPWPWVPWGPAGALRSDAEDLLHYTAAYLGAGKAGDVPVPAELTKAMALAREPTEVQITETPANRQAYAWVIVHAANEANVIVLKDGGTAGFSSCVAMMPERGTGVVVLINSTRTLACKKARAVLHAMAVAADKLKTQG